jgi:hypothetical protein
MRPRLDKENRGFPRGVSEYMFSVRWHGFLYVPETGQHRFDLKLGTQNGARMQLGGQWVLGDQAVHLTGEREQHVRWIRLKKGLYSLRLDFYHKGGHHGKYRCHFDWQVGKKPSGKLNLEYYLYYDPKVPGTPPPPKK